MKKITQLKECSDKSEETIQVAVEVQADLINLSREMEEFSRLLLRQK
jgi:hypothetical protein